VAWLARSPGKLVVLGEYAVLDGAEALVLAVDRYARAELAPSTAAECCFEARAGTTETRVFAPGRPSGIGLVDLLGEHGGPAGAWVGAIDSREFHADGTKLGLGSSAAALCSWAAVWEGATAAREGRAPRLPDAEALIALHRRFQGGGSGIDVAASRLGGVSTFALGGDGAVRIGSVRLPNSVGFAGIFAGRSAATPDLLARYAAWKAHDPRRSRELVAELQSISAAGCAAARGGDAQRFLDAVVAYGAGLEKLGGAIGADIVTAEHRQIAAHAREFGVAYKVSGAGGGDVGIALAADSDALDAFKRFMDEQGFGVVSLKVAPQGLMLEERIP